jgi:hypothetical protein
MSLLSRNRCNASLAILVVLEALLRGIIDGTLAGDDLLDDSEDVAPVLEDGEGYVFARAVGDEI